MSSSPLDKGTNAEAITDFDRKVYASLTKVLNLPDDFKDFMFESILTTGLPVPISQVIGFSQFTAQHTGVIQPGLAESYTSNVYGDLATAGPALTGLPDGSYVVLHGCGAEGNAGVGGYQSIQVNSAAVSNDDKCGFNLSGFANVSVAVLKTLSNNGNNTITCKYKSTSNTIQVRFEGRWLMALRYANA